MAGDDPRPAADPGATPPAARPPVATPRPPAAVPATPKARPDPRPMRLALGAGTLAAVSLMTAGLVRYPVPVAADDAGDATTAGAVDAVTVEVIATARPEVRIKHKTVYVHLKRGQKAPKGAKVIEGKAPPPRVVVTRVAGKPAATRQTRVRQVRSTPRKVAKTRQSGG